MEAWLRCFWLTADVFTRGTRCRPDSVYHGHFIRPVSAIASAAQAGEPNVHCRAHRRVVSLWRRAKLFRASAERAAWRDAPCTLWAGSSAPMRECATWMTLLYSGTMNTRVLILMNVACQLAGKKLHSFPRRDHRAAADSPDLHSDRAMSLCA